MPVRHTLARNTIFNAAGRFWEAAVGIVLTAYIVEKVGLTYWGLWSLVGVFTGYAALLDFGIGSSFAKYIAEHAARDEHDTVSEIVTTGFFFYALLGVAIIAAGWPCVDALMALLQWMGPDRARDLGDPLFINDVRFLLRWGLLLFAASNCISAFTAVQTGLQRMGITNLVSFIASWVKIAATIAFLETGFGIRGLIYVNALVLAGFGVASVVIAFVLHPKLQVAPRHFTRYTLNRLFQFGWRAQVARLSNLIMFDTDKLFVVFMFRYLGLVGLYDIGLSLANKMRQAPVLLLTAILPAASDLDARGDHARLRALYLRSTKYVGAITLPLALFTIVAAGLILRAWMGEKRDLDMAAWVCRIIAMGYIANILPGAGVSIALGKGRADIQMNAGLIATFANLLLTLIFVYLFGFYGIAIGTALSMFLSTAWFFHAMRPVVDVPAREVIRAGAVWPALAALPGLGIALAGEIITTGWLGRIPNGVALLITAGAFGVLYLVLIPFTPLFDAYDIAFFESSLRLDRIPGYRIWRKWRAFAESFTARMGETLRRYAEKDGRGYPDWALRYKPVINRLHNDIITARHILELGANENGLARFTNQKIIAVDRDGDHLKAAAAISNQVIPVQADACALPFRTGSVNLCVSMDMLEHIPAPVRPNAATEIIRVLDDNGSAAIGFPAGTRAMSAEQDIAARYLAYTGRKLVWFEEHAACGLPDPATVTHDFRQAAAGCFTVSSESNAPLWLWRWMWRVMLCGWPGRGNALAQAGLRAITPILCRIKTGAGYRTSVWIVPNKKR